MKKLIALILAAAMVMGLIACGAKTPATEAATEATAAAATEATAKAEPEATEEALPFEGVELTMCMAPLKGGDADIAFYDEQLKAFTEKTGATVKVETTTWGDMATYYLTGFMTGTAADVMYLTSATAYPFIENGYLADLTPYWSEEEIALETYWSTGTTGDKQCLVPYYGGSAYRCYVYNMEILRECGVEEIPTTWDEFLATCEAIKTNRPDVYPLSLSLSSADVNMLAQSFIPFLYQSGGSLLNEDLSAWTIDTPEALEAMNFIQTLLDKGYLSQTSLSVDAANMVDQFKQGQAAIVVAAVPQTHFAETDFEWVASTELANKKSAVIAPVDYLAVNADSVNVEAAVELVKYLHSDEMAQTMFDTGFATNGKLKTTWPVFITDERVADVLAHPERGCSMPMGPESAMVNESMITNLQLMIMGELTPEEALKAMQADADDLLS